MALSESWENGVDAFRRGDRPARGAPKLVVQSDAHYCIARSAGILGIGTNNVVKAALDEKRRVKAARALTRLPLVAIGGITAENGREVIEAGADAVAVISALLPQAGQGMSERVRDFLAFLR